MSQYTALTEMGITRFKEISHYTLRQEGAAIDVLKIYYDRAKGSLLPTSRKYKFGRATKTVRIDSGTNGTGEVNEISPFLQRALSELDSLVERRRHTVDDKAALLEDINHLEQVMQAKIQEIRERVERLK